MYSRPLPWWGAARFESVSPETTSCQRSGAAGRAAAAVVSGVVGADCHDGGAGVPLPLPGVVPVVPAVGSAPAAAVPARAPRTFLIAIAAMPADAALAIG